MPRRAGQTDVGRGAGDPVVRPRASVVITCHNQGAFLAQAIESALAQTYPGVEVIVVDDGSTDETAEVAARYPDVRLVSQPRAGLPAARNAGLGLCTGDVVTFLDADDRLLPHAVETGVRALLAHPEAACVAGHYRLIDAAGTVTAEWTRAPVDFDPYAALLRRNHIGMHAAVLYRRAVLVELGGFDTTLRACEDYDVYLRLARAHDIHVHGVLIAEYRRHAGNLSRDPVLMLEAALRVHRRQWPYVRTRPRYLAAYREGRAFWRDYYGGQVLELLRTGTGDATRIRRAAWALLVHHPWGLARAGLPAVRAALLRRIWRRIRRGIAAAIRRGAPAPRRRSVRFGDLRRLTPISEVFGFDRGQPIDRRYIEAFVARHRADVRGRVLEFGDAVYTTRFGGDRVAHSDVWHVEEERPGTTIVGDLTRADHVPSEAFDCIICTQTLHLIYDLPAAVRTLHRILKPGGVVLATVPGVSRVASDEWGPRWCWSLTVTSARRLFEECFPTDRIEVAAAGNVLAATAFHYGLASHELRPEELDTHDPHYPVVVTVRAQKPQAG